MMPNDLFKKEIYFLWLETGNGKSTFYFVKNFKKCVTATERRNLLYMTTEREKDF